MVNGESATHIAGVYREMASEIWSVVPTLTHSQAIEDLRVLAARYERLANYLERAASPVTDMPLQYRRQAG